MNTRDGESGVFEKVVFDELLSLSVFSKLKFYSVDNYGTQRHLLFG